MAAEMNKEVERSEGSTNVELQLRQLALVDRIIGLESEIAALKSNANTEELLASLRSTTTWRIGSLVLAPILWTRRIPHSIRGRARGK
ncbi:hypothetical protein GCM10027022_13390 [Alpinimonas psychrophila]